MTTALWPTIVPLPNDQMLVSNIDRQLNAFFACDDWASWLREHWKMPADLAEVIERQQRDDMERYTQDGKYNPILPPSEICTAFPFDNKSSYWYLLGQWADDSTEHRHHYKLRCYNEAVLMHRCGQRMAENTDPLIFRIRYAFGRCLYPNEACQLLSPWEPDCGEAVD